MMVSNLLAPHSWQQQPADRITGPEKKKKNNKKKKERETQSRLFPHGLSPSFLTYISSPPSPSSTERSIVIIKRVGPSKKNSFAGYESHLRLIWRETSVAAQSSAPDQRKENEARTEIAPHPLDIYCISLHPIPSLLQSSSLCKISQNER